MLDELMDSKSMVELYFVEKKNKPRTLFDKIQMHFIIQKLARYLANGETTVEVSFLSDRNRIELESKGYHVETIYKGQYNWEECYKIFTVNGDLDMPRAGGQEL